MTKEYIQIYFRDTIEHEDTFCLIEPDVFTLMKEPENASDEVKEIVKKN